MYVANLEELVENTDYPSDHKGDIAIVLREHEVDSLDEILVDWIEHHSVFDSTAAYVHRAIQEYKED